MTFKNRLAKIEAALVESREQHIIKIHDRQGVEPTGWRHSVDTSGGLGWNNPKTIYPADADLSHLFGLHVFFAEYGD